MKNFDQEFHKQFAIEFSEPSLGKKAQLQRKQEFKEYLWRTGVQLDLARCLKLLFQQRVKPHNPVDYIRSRIGVPRMSAAEYRDHQERLQVYLHRIKELQEEIQWVETENALSFSSTSKDNSDMSYKSYLSG